jgi:hypothetical protein
MNNPDLAHWNLLTFLAFVVAGLPILGIVLGLSLMISRLRVAGRMLIFGSLGAYIGGATATFTSIGGAFFTYVFHLWHFPEKDCCVSTAAYVTALTVGIIIPIFGVLAGAFIGVRQAKRDL